MSNLGFSIYQEIAKSYVDSEIEKIQNITHQNYPQFIKDKSNQIAQYLQNQCESIQDRFDLMGFKSNLYLISQLIDLFLMSNPSKSSWWAMSLIKECYEKCQIDFTKRNIIIIHYLNSKDYSVIADLLSFLPPELKHLQDPDKPIDVFIIPSEAKHDIASISLLGHEVGHVYWKINFDKLADVLKSEFDSHYKPGTLFDFNELENKRKRIASHIQEFLCDEIGRYILGPAFDFALLKLFSSSWYDQVNSSSTHPPEQRRIIQSLESLNAYTSSLPDVQECFKNIINNFANLSNSQIPLFKNADDEFSENTAKSIHKTTGFTSIFTNVVLDRTWKLASSELDAFRPPFEKVSRNKPEIISPTEALVTTSLYYYGKQYLKTNEYFLHNEESTETKQELLRRRLVEHLRYAISLYDFVKTSQEKLCNANFKVEDMETTLWEYRDRQVGGKLNPFVVTPSTNPKSQYSSNSVDLRLGNVFLIHKTTGYTHIAPEPKLDNQAREHIPLDAFYDELFIPVGKEFILHPHQFVLAATLEYISIPYDYYALVLGRSSWGRLGLNIATATAVHSGFRGCITLELRNLGETPLPLKVGLRIAQLCLISVPIQRSHKGYFATANKYIGPVVPEIPKIKGDADWDLLNGFNNFE